MRLILSFFCVLVLSVSSVRAAEFRDWRDGDLIFQNSGTSQTTAILVATGGSFSHVGIVKRTRRGPIVVEAVQPVKETPLAEFIARGEGGAYAVYRVRNLTGEQTRKVFAEARKYYGRPYDMFFRPDKEHIYCSELVWLAFSAAGRKIGREVPFGSLNVNNWAVRKIFSMRWRQHPDCREAGGPEACWVILSRQPIVTPASLVADDSVTEKVFSNGGNIGFAIKSGYRNLMKLFIGGQ